MTITVHTTTVAETRHRAHLDEKQLHALIAQAVAEQAGVDLAAENVRVERVWISSNSGSINRGTEYSAEVSLVVDHRPQSEPERRQP